MNLKLFKTFFCKLQSSLSELELFCRAQRAFVKFMSQNQWQFVSSVKLTLNHLITSLIQCARKSEGEERAREGQKDEKRSETGTEKLP